MNNSLHSEGCDFTTVSINSTDAMTMNWCSKYESRSCNLRLIRLIGDIYYVYFSHPVYSLMRKVLPHLGVLLVGYTISLLDCIKTRCPHRAWPESLVHITFGTKWMNCGDQSRFS